MIRILIADDHTLMREGLKQIIGANGEIQVAAEASDSFQTLDLVRKQSFDLVLLDMSMPGRSGIDLIKLIRVEKPRLPILVLSMHKEEEYAVRTVRAGANGYLCKDSASDQLLKAILKVAAGGNYISPEFAGDLAFGLIAQEERLPHEVLSDREFQIFQMLVAGAAGSEIAQKLNLSPKTVSTYKARIMEKMKIGNMADLIRYAMKYEFSDGSSGP